MIAFYNTAFFEEDDLSLKVTDLSIQRGFAVFDFFRTKDFIPLFLSDYLERFYNSISLMQLEPPCSQKELTSIIRELIAKNNIAESGIKLLLTGGYSADGYTPSTPNLIITQQHVTLTTAEKFAEGIRIITWDYQRELPEVKSINYMMGVWLQRKVKEKQAADVLYHKNGIITEFPRSNVFIVTAEQTVVTPAENILPGITRKKLLELAGQQYRVETRDVHLDEVKNAAEVFTTSTTKRILPITRVDDQLIGNGKPGPVTMALNQAFVQLEEDYVKSFKW